MFGKNKPAVDKEVSLGLDQIDRYICVLVRSLAEATRNMCEEKTPVDELVTQGLRQIAPYSCVLIRNLYGDTWVELYPNWALLRPRKPDFPNQAMPSAPTFSFLDSYINLIFIVFL